MITFPLEMILFGVLAALGLGGALLVVFSKNPVASALNLILVFFAFAGIYAMLEAHLLAALQIFVYAGAIMVLFVFVIMLLNADTPSLDFKRGPRTLRFMGPLACAGLAGLFAYAFMSTPVGQILGPYTPQAIDEHGGNTQVLSELLFAHYMLPLELTSALLLSAIVGAVVLAKRKLLVRREAE